MKYTGRYIKSKQSLTIGQDNIDEFYDFKNDKVITRPRLIDKISPPCSRLTYIHADAGYGKTTLLLQYARSRKVVAWMPFDEKDSDLVFFLRHLETSIRSKLASFSFHYTDYIPFIKSKDFADIVISALLQNIGDRVLTIIMDDVHIISNDTITGLLTQLVKICPVNVTLVMASRHELWGGLYRLKLAGEVVELTKNDLCFSQEEAEELWGFFDEDAYLTTEGWILGIQSYRITREENKKPSISKLQGHRELYRYLLSDILAGLPSEIQYFLKSTSWLPLMKISECNSLLGIHNSRKILEELVDRNIFTLSLSDTSYRYHTLFKSFLQQNDDGLGQKILKKAMQQQYSSGDYEEAAEYSIILEDGEFLQLCINNILSKPFDSGLSLRLKRYIDFLEAGHIQMKPCALLAKGMHLSDQGNFYEAEKYLTAVIPYLDKEDKLIYLHAMTHKARVLRNRVSFEESSSCIDELLPLLGDVPMRDRYEVIIEKIHILTLTSQLTEALELTRTMIEKSLIFGAVDVKTWFERYLTVIYFYMGDYKSCIEAYEKSLLIPKKEQDWLMRHCVGAYAAKAYQITGQEEKAMHILEHELESMRRLGFYEEFSINYLLYAEIIHSMELLKLYEKKTFDFSAAYKYLNMAEDYAFLNRSTRDHYIFARIWKKCAGILENPDKAGQCIDEVLMLMVDTTPFFQSLAYGRIANALDTLGQSPQQCKEYFKKSIEIGEEISSYAYAAVAYGRLAAIYLREGKEEEAKEYTKKFLELSHKYGHHYYIRFKPLFGSVLRFAAESGIETEFAYQMLSYGEYAHKKVYINALGSFYIAPYNDRDNPVKIRTQKARELLAYLLENRSGVTKERIFADIWWDSEVDVSSLFHTRRGEIRRAFESMGAQNPILNEKGIYMLNMEEIACDYDEFKEAVCEFQNQPAVESAEKASAYYKGRYLSDMEALWAEASRLKLEDSFLEVSEFLVKSYENSGQRVKKADLIRKMNR